MPATAVASPFWFSDPIAERAFRLHFARGSATRHVIASTLGMLLLLLQLASAAAGYSDVPVCKVLVRMTWIVDFFVVYSVLGWEQCTLCLGPYSTWKRLLATCYFWQLAKVVSSGISVHKYLLVLHSADAIARPASVWYWSGSMLCWLAVLVMDSWIGPVGAAAMLQRMTKAASSNSSGMLLLDVVLPGLVLLWWELKMRKAWLAQHWLAGQLSAAAAAATGAGTAAPPAAVPTPGSPVDLAQQQQQEKTEAQQLQPACSASSSSSGSEAQHAAMPATLHALAPAGACPPTAAAASAAAGSHSNAAAAANGAVALALQQQQQGMLPNRLRYRSLVSRRVVSFKFTQAPGEDAAFLRYGY
jgi:hypothetical protein